MPPIMRRQPADVITRPLALPSVQRRDPGATEEPSPEGSRSWPSSGRKASSAAWDSAGCRPPSSRRHSPSRQWFAVQNLYNLVYRGDDALVERTAREHIACASYVVLGGFTALQSNVL